jgi:hypothetical protein
LETRPPGEFVSTGRDTLRRCLIYGLVAPMLALLLSGAGFYAAVAVAGVLGDNPAVLLSLAGIGLLTPPCGILALVVRDVQRRSIDRIVIGPERVSWFRGARTFSIPVERIAVLRLGPSLCSVLPDRGPALHLPRGCWPLTEIRRLLKETLTPGLSARLQSDLDAGRSRRYFVHGRLPALHLAGGSILASLGLILGSAVLRSGGDPGFRLRAGVGAAIFLIGGAEMLRRFFQTVRHRIDVDRRSIRSGGWFLSASIPWEEMTRAQENARGLRIAGKPGARPVQIEHEIDHYPVLLALAKGRLRASRTTTT